MIIPLYYFSCYIKGSDISRIERYMGLIPEQHQKKVADRYERIFRRGQGWKGRNRNKANKFLYKIAFYHYKKQNNKNNTSLTKLKTQIKDKKKAT